MKKSRSFYFFYFFILCSVIVLVLANDLFSQRGMKIAARTEAGQNIPLYNNSYALVVGNGTYINGWDPLNGALKDVKEVATALEKHGFNVTLKTDIRKAAFETVFEAFIRNGRRDENSRLLFYYAGHGYTETLRTGDQLGYLVMVDSPLPTTAGEIDGSKNIDMESLVTQAKRIDARHVLYMLDSCFSGSILNARSVPKPSIIQDSIKYPVRQFITAGRAEQPVPDHSFFKTAFLDILAGRVEEPIPDGYITGEELGLYLKNAVSTYNPAQTPQYGKINDPNLDKGDFVFVIQQEEAASSSPTFLSTMATLTVTSIPSSADIYVNNDYIGRTPLHNYEIDTGVRREKQIEVGLSLSGYKSRVSKVTLRGGQRAALQNVRLEQVISPIARLTVTSTPSGATIYVDDMQVGTTPLQEHEIDTGAQHEKQIEVGLELLDHRSLVAKLMLEGGKTKTWDVRLEKTLPMQPRPTKKPVPSAGNAPIGMVLIPANEKPGHSSLYTWDKIIELTSNKGNADEKPIYTASVGAFYMDVYEVTNAQYKKFVDANPRWQKGHIEERFYNGVYLFDWKGNNYPRGKGNHPVVYVSWYAAMAYAEWAKKRLPTEAEWEYAARGGLIGKKYPWGDMIDADKANYSNSYTGGTTAVGKYAANGYGLYDMAGNVWEWCLDEYNGGFYAVSPGQNPLSDANSIKQILDNYAGVNSARVLRGGSWSSGAHHMQCAELTFNLPTYTTNRIGFRCVRPVTP